MRKLFDGRLYASHWQFVIYDSAIDDDDDENVPELLERLLPTVTKRLSADGYLNDGSFVAVRTGVQDGLHWLQVFLADAAPRFSEEHDFKARMPFEMRSNRLHVKAPTDADPQVVCKVARGKYKLFLFRYHQGAEACETEFESARKKKPLIDRNFEGYRIVLIPEAKSTKSRR